MEKRVYPDNNARYPYNPGVMAQNIDVDYIAHKVADIVSADTPAAQVKRALKKFRNDFMPTVYMIQVIGAAVSTAYTGQVNMDATYGFFVSSWNAWVQGTQDVNYYITQLNYPSGRNLIIGNFPIGLITRNVGIPFPWAWYVPAQSGIVIQVQTGSTTAPITVDFAFTGYRVPAGYIAALERNMA